MLNLAAPTLPKYPFYLLPGWGGGYLMIELLLFPWRFNRAGNNWELHSSNSMTNKIVECLIYLALYLQSVCGSAVLGKPFLFSQLVCA